MKIALVIGSMKGAGGAERVFSHMINYWVDKGYNAHLLSFDALETQSFYPLPKELTWHKLGEHKEQWWFRLPATFFKSIPFIRNEIKLIQPDIIISFINVTNLVSVIATRFLKIPLIISDRNNPKYQKIRWIYRFLQKRLYPLANRLVVLTSKQISIYSKTLQKKTVAILNPFYPSQDEIPTYSIEGPYILSVGRLRKQKGQVPPGVVAPCMT